MVLRREHCRLNPAARATLAKDPINESLMILSDEGLNNTFQIDWSRLDPHQWRDDWNRGIAR